MIEEILKNKYGGLLSALDIYETKTSLILSKIIVNPENREKNVGTSVMEDFVRYADENGKIAALTPSSDFGSNVNKLIQFYKKFGFKMNKGYNKNFEYRDTMIRNPKTAGMKENTKQTIKKLLRESLLRENYVDKALDNLSNVGDFYKLNEVDKLILLGAAGDERKTKELSLILIYKVNHSFGKRMVKVRVKPINQQPIDHKFSKEMAGEVGWLSPYIHYSDDMEPYNTITFDKMEYHNEHGDKSYQSLPIMLDNVYPIDYGDEPKQFTKHDIEREIERRQFLDKFGLGSDDESF